MTRALILLLMWGIACASEERQPTRGPARIYKQLDALLAVTCAVLLIGGTRLYRR
jgi:hypothetical protein